MYFFKSVLLERLSPQQNRSLLNHQVVSGGLLVQIEPLRKKKVATLTMVIDTQEILRLAAKKWGGDSKVATATGLNRATIWRLRNGRHPRTYPATIGKIVKALNEENP